MFKGYLLTDNSEFLGIVEENKHSRKSIGLPLSDKYERNDSMTGVIFNVND